MKRITNKMGYVLIIIALIAMTAANATGQVPPVEVYRTDGFIKCPKTGYYALPMLNKIDTALVVRGQEIPENAEFLGESTPKVWVEVEDWDDTETNVLRTNCHAVYIMILYEFKGSLFTAIHYLREDTDDIGYQSGFKLMEYLILPDEIGPDALGMDHAAKDIHIR